MLEIEMAIEATGSKYGVKSGIIITMACMAFGVYCLYDGWINEKYQEDHTNAQTGEPNFDLMFNRVYGPAACGAAGLYFLIGAMRLKSRKIVADENGLTFNTGKTIPYTSMKKIDKTPLEKKGWFSIEYEQGQATKTLKLTDRQYDNLGLLLDEIVRCTGAAPAETSSTESTNEPA